MSKRAKLAILIAGALLVCALTILTLAGREPRYQGLTMGQWLNRTPPGPQAEEALLALCTNNLSLLVKRIDYDPQKDPCAGFLNWLSKVSRSRWLYQFATRRTAQAEEAHRVLYRLGAKAAPAIPPLTEIVERGTGDPCSRALTVLASTGDGGLAVVASQASTNTAVYIRLSAVAILDRHTDSRVAFLGLTNALDDSDARVRSLASEGISNHLQWNPHLAPKERTQLRQRIHD